MQTLNRVVLIGNLTSAPEMKTVGTGTTICQLRLAVNSRIKRGGEWTEKPNYFDVTCFGSLAENCGQYLAKGKPVAVDGRLDWREWQTQTGEKRQAVSIVADAVQFLGDGKREERPPADFDVPIAAADFAPASAAPADDDIPFHRESQRLEFEAWRGHANR